MAEPIDTAWSNRGRGDKASPSLPPSYSTTCRSCRGLLFYAPVLRAGLSANGEVTSSLTSSPVCVGLSSAAPSGLSVDRIHAARQIPQEQRVSYLVILGHSVFKAPGGGPRGEEVQVNMWGSASGAIRCSNAAARGAGVKMPGC
jgi:hypothetical protein